MKGVMIATIALLVIVIVGGVVVVVLGPQFDSPVDGSAPPAPGQNQAAGATSADSGESATQTDAAEVEARLLAEIDRLKTRATTAEVRAKHAEAKVKQLRERVRQLESGRPTRRGSFTPRPVPKPKTETPAVKPTYLDRIDISDEIVDAKVALDGTLLVFKFKNLMKLGLYDIAANKFVKFIRLLDLESIYACGGKRLVCYSNLNRKFQVYDLESHEKLETKDYNGDKILTHICMGLYKGDVAFVSLAAGTGALDRRTYGLLDVESLRITEFKSARGRRYFHNTSFRDRIHLRADGGLKRITSWATSHSPTGVCLTELNGSEYSNAYEHNSEGYLLPSLDGEYIFTGSGSIYKGSIKNRIRKEMGFTFPVLGTDYYLVYPNRHRTGSRRGEPPATFVLKSRKTLQTIKRIPAAVSLKTISWAKNSYTLDRSVFAIGKLDRLVQIDNKERWIYLIKLGLP